MKRERKRLAIIAVLMIVLSITTLFAGCGKDDTTTAGGTTVGATEPKPTEPKPTEADPTEPSAEPTEPSAEPTEPSAEPTEPSAEPTEPSAEPTEPSAEPTEPSAEPTEPSAEPTEPSAEPTEPSAEPTDPSEPEAPSFTEDEQGNYNLVDEDMGIDMTLTINGDNTVDFVDRAYEVNATGLTVTIVEGKYCFTYEDPFLGATTAIFYFEDNTLYLDPTDMGTFVEMLKEGQAPADLFDEEQQGTYNLIDEDADLDITLVINANTVDFIDRFNEVYVAGLTVSSQNGFFYFTYEDPAWDETNVVFYFGADGKVYIDPTDMGTYSEMTEGEAPVDPSEPTEPSEPGTEPSEPDVPAETWSIIGSINGSNWDEDFVLTASDEENVLVSKVMELAVGNEFKIRLNYVWDNAYPEQNYVVNVKGSYRISFNTVTHEIKLIWCGEGEEPTPEVPTENVWSAIGALAGTSWDTDFEMVESDTENVLITERSFTLNAGDEFKIRLNGSWSESYPGSVTNYRVETSGVYYITFNVETKEIGLVTDNAGETDPTDPSEPADSTTVNVVIADYADANSWSNSTLYDEIKMNDDITVTVSGTANGSYGLNTGKYYENGENWRIYQNESPAIVIEAAEGKTIVSVKITYDINNDGVLTNGDAQIESGTVITVNGNSITLSVGNTGTKTNGQVRITAIEVIYN